MDLKIKNYPSFKLKPIIDEANKIDLDNLLKYSQSLLIEKEIIKKFYSKNESILKEQILLALSNHGFNFENEDQFLEFCKTKCELVSQNQIQTLLVGKKPICRWDNNPEITTDGNKIIATSGFFKVL